MIAFKCCLLYVALCISAGLSRQVDLKSDTFVKYLFKSWKHCTTAPTLTLCFKQLSLLSLDNLVKSNEPIDFPGEMISLVKTEQSGNNSVKPLSENDLQKHLPKDVRLQEKTMDILLASAYNKFLSTRSIQVKFPHDSQMKPAADESRGDKKKGNNGFASGAMMVAMCMLPMALAGIGALAGKALMTSMLALMMSALLASRKSHEGGGGSSYEVISIPAGGGHHHGRHLPATELAYEAQTTR